MKALLNRLPIYVTVLLLSGIPLLIALIFSVTEIQQLQKQTVQAQTDEESVQTILLFDDLAHNLAVERGLTAGVLGSKGNSEQVAALNKQRQVVDQVIVKLNQFLPQFVPTSLFNKLKADILTELKRLAEVRKGVDALAPTIAPFNYYSNINRLAIDNGQTLLSLIKNADVASLGNGLIAIVTVKEKAGQVRGALNGAFARKSSNPQQYTAISQYLSDGQYALRLADILLPKEINEQLKQTQQEKVWQQVEQIQQHYLEQRNNLDQLDGPKAIEWFSLATDRIKSLIKVRNSIENAMVSNSQQQKDAAVSNMNIIIVTTVVVALVVVVFLLVALSNLKQRVRHLTLQLREMSNNRNLTLKFNQSGGDEIAHIAMSINQLTQSMRMLLEEVYSANEHSHSTFNQITDNAGDLGGSSQATTAKCQSISAAITELSQSSVEIATSSERALEETRMMMTKTNQCQEQSKHSFVCVERLVEQIEQTQSCMQALSADAESVGKIVDTITAISEQTNLLALNAAIEAARAGEYGRGFAVVSTEVRDLAQRSKDATEHIAQLLANMGQNTEKAVDNMNKSQEATHETFTSVTTVNESVAELEQVIELVNEHIVSIANATTEQSKANEEVDVDITTLANIAEHTGVLANQLEDVVGNYRQEVKQVSAKLAQFKLA